jgi:hypothetical protein
MNAPQASSKCIVDYDRVPATSPLKSIYTNPRMIQLVQNTVGVQLHLSACPYNAAYYNEFQEVHLSVPTLSPDPTSIAG